MRIHSYQSRALNAILGELIAVGVSKQDILDCPVSVDSAAPWDLPALSTVKNYKGIPIRRLMHPRVNLTRGSSQLSYFRALVRNLSKRQGATWFHDIGRFVSHLWDPYKPQKSWGLFSAHGLQDLQEGGVQAAYQIIAEVCFCVAQANANKVFVCNERDLYLLDYQGREVGIKDLRLTEPGKFPACPVNIGALWDAPRPVRSGFPDLFDQIRWASLARANDFEDYEAFCEALSVCKFTCTLDDLVYQFEKVYPQKTNKRHINPLSGKEPPQAILDRHIAAIDNRDRLEFIYIRMWPDLKNLGYTSDQFKKEFGNPYREIIIPKLSKLEKIKARLQELKVQHAED